MIKGCIFDLDGVIVDTAKYHYLAWKQLASRLGFGFTPEQGEATKGVSRMASLEIVLAAGGLSGRFTDEQKQRMADEKNTCYLEYVGCMTPAELLPGIMDFLRELRSAGIAVVLGSSSKNALLILDRCGIRDMFDAVVDGTLVLRAKPEPEVFLSGAEKVGVAPSQCVVFEDAESGIEAAMRAGMRSVGVGDSPKLSAASMRIASFEGFTLNMLIEGVDNQNNRI